MSSPTDLVSTCDCRGALLDEQPETRRDTARPSPDEQSEAGDTMRELSMLSQHAAVPMLHAQTTQITVSPTVVRILGNPWLVWGLLLLCGPIGLPALWLSPRFSRAAKIGITGLLAFVTAILPIAIYWYCCDYLMRPLLDALAP